VKLRPFKMPKKVRITSKVHYKVVHVDTFDDIDQVGECCHDSRIISIKKKLSPKRKEEILWHEICHAIVEENKFEISDADEEFIIMNIERALAKVIRLNNLRFR